MNDVPQLVTDNVIATVTLKYDSETKAYHKYSHKADHIFTIYLSKATFEGREPPKTITATLT